MKDDTPTTLHKVSDSLSPTWYKRMISVAGTSWTAPLFSTLKVQPTSSFEAGLKDPQYLPEHLKNPHSNYPEGTDPTSVMDDVCLSGSEAQSSTPDTPRAESTGVQTPLNKNFEDGATSPIVLEGPATPPRERQRRSGTTCCPSPASSKTPMNSSEKKKRGGLKRVMMLSVAILAAAAVAGQRVKLPEKRKKQA